MPVNLQTELADLFNPSRFICIDSKLKEKILKLKSKIGGGKVEINGFLPSEISNSITDTSA